ncbi:MAG TPA: nucleoside hydrolase [Balneolaceae bacterium]|nr:nucleoside hydrolase [Balneolaceae bacterium]
MISFRFFTIGLLIFLFPIIANAQKKQTRIIFDSDMGPDYDDVGAIAVLHALADSGEAKILATVASNRYPKISQVFDVFNTYFGRPDIPIGIPKGASVEMKDWQDWSDYIVSKYPHDIASNNEVPSSVDVYRKVLSSQPDHSVTIETEGFLTNLADLLESGSDQYSSLNGLQLVQKKVKKLVCMAGAFPNGKEFNVDKDIPAANYVFENWPTKIIFSGFNIGKKIKTGIPLIRNDSIKNSPVKDVFRISIPQAEEDKNGRMSWDETAVLVAVRGADPYYYLIPGRAGIDSDGKTTWDASKTGHYRLVEKKSVEYMQHLINTLMQHQP